MVKKRQKKKNEKKKKAKGALSQKQLDKVSGGAIPTPVNGQITDSVTQA